MNNQWRKNANCMVVWADKTYDTCRTCGECGKYDCALPVHPDHYAEIGQTRMEMDEAENSAMNYWNYMYASVPLGGKRDHDGEMVVNEYFTANPDGLAEDILHTSGINEEQHEYMQEAYDLLSSPQQEAWDLCMREQISQTDAAEKLGITRESVKSRLMNAKTTVTNYLRSKQDDALSS